MTHVFSGQGGGLQSWEARDYPPSVFILPGHSPSPLRTMAFFCDVLIGGQRARRGSIGECAVRTTEDGAPAGGIRLYPRLPVRTRTRRGDSNLSGKVSLGTPAGLWRSYPFAQGSTHAPPAPRMGSGAAGR
jgi:hypothetical protein